MICEAKVLESQGGAPHTRLAVLAQQNVFVCGGLPLIVWELDGVPPDWGMWVPATWSLRCEGHRVGVFRSLSGRVMTAAQFVVMTAVDLWCKMRPRFCFGLFEVIPAPNPRRHDVLMVIFSNSEGTHPHSRNGDTYTVGCTHATK